MFLLCSIFILLLLYIVGVLIMMRGNFNVLQKNAALDSDAYFADCKLLEKDCNDTSCNLYTWCGDGDHSVCRIYDCGNNYGIFTKDLNNKIKTERKAKPDMKALDAQKDACSGSMQILQQDCVEGKMQVKVKLNTKGECKINTFALIYKDAGAQPNEFVSLGGDTYQITAYSCGTIDEIVPGTKDGIALDFLTQA